MLVFLGLHLACSTGWWPGQAQHVTLSGSVVGTLCGHTFWKCCKNDKKVSASSNKKSVAVRPGIQGGAGGGGDPSVYPCIALAEGQKNREKSVRLFEAVRTVPGEAFRLAAGADSKTQAHALQTVGRRWPDGKQPRRLKQ